MTVVMSEKMKQYFDRIQKDIQEIYDIATQARKAGIDPSCEVECPPAVDMAGRVEKLVGPAGIGDTIRKWQEEGADQDEVCFRAMDWVLEGKFGKFEKNTAVDLAIRVALAIKTEGVVSAPLEGIAKIIIRQNNLGGEPYLSLYFAGPIRAAGGTVQAFAVLCAEYVRRKMGIAEWKATKDEVGRMVEEVKLYDRIMHLQYPSTPEELAYTVEHLTVELNGEPTEQQEVSAHRDLPRFETNFVRGGPCLVINDGLLLKAKKIQKIIDKRKIDGWEWMKNLKKFAQGDAGAKLQDEAKDKAKDYGGDTYKGQKMKEDVKQAIDVEIETPVKKRKKALDEKNPPLNKYIADIIAGRPVFAYPSEIGGHRLRYGRSRNTGLAACGVHPSQMLILEKFLATGTQIRIERPGKSGSTMPVTSIEPPIVLMHNGDVKQLWNIKEANAIAEKRLVKKILFIGDMLFGYGEFSENNHVIVPSGYVEEWWARELEQKVKEVQEKQPNLLNNLAFNLTLDTLNRFIKDPFENIPTGLEALEISVKFQIGIHPRYLDHWGNINGVDLLEIRKAFCLGLQNLLSTENTTQPFFSKGSWQEITEKLAEGFLIPNTPPVKTFLENAFVEHDCDGDSLRFQGIKALVLCELLGLGSTRYETSDMLINKTAPEKTALEIFPLLTTIIVPDKAPYYLGSRMGRPEKAKERKMKPPVHVLFPVGHDSELQRCLQTASGNKSIEVDICQKECPKCNAVTFLNQCPRCSTHTEFRKICPRCNTIFTPDKTMCDRCNAHLSYFSNKKISLKKFFDNAFQKFSKTVPDVKGVKGMSSEFKAPEPIEKGILRAVNDVWVYKDGTIRADAIDIPLTHFTCREIDVSIERIKELGYDLDVYGQPLENPDQVIELHVQDILLTHHLAEYFIKVAKFVDDELEYLYGSQRFYNITKKEDLIGHYFAGLAPHTSAAIVGRLIGFTYAEAGYAHPFWQAAKRRNCDGDEDGIMILLDCLLNFSRYYLPAKLGGKMDAPLVLSVLLDPREVDGESHNVDYAAQYPLQFYQDAANYAKPGDVEKYMKLYKHFLGKEGQFEGCMFTHPTKSIHLGPRKSAYTLFETMEEKIESQLWLAKTIKAVDAKDVARKVISSHFAPDILGNLRSFSTQGFRCVKCGEKFRRAPLSGKCTACGGKILMTVTPGGITKYLSKAQDMIKEFDLGAYTKQRWELIERYVNSLTNNPRVKQKSIASFFK